MITLSHYLTLSALLFTISVAGIFLNRKNVIVLLMCVELLLLAANFNFIAFSRYLDDSAGQVFAAVKTSLNDTSAPPTDPLIHH